MALTLAARLAPAWPWPAGIWGRAGSSSKTSWTRDAINSFSLRQLLLTDGRDSSLPLCFSSPRFHNSFNWGSQIMLLSTQKPPVALHLIQSKRQSPSSGFKANSTLSGPSLNTPGSSQPHGSPCCFKNILSTLACQHLCTCYCCLCLDFSSL